MMRRKWRPLLIYTLVYDMDMMCVPNWYKMHLFLPLNVNCCWITSAMAQVCRSLVGRLVGWFFGWLLLLLLLCPPLILALFTLIYDFPQIRQKKIFLIRDMMQMMMLLSLLMIIQLRVRSIQRMIAANWWVVVVVSPIAAATYAVDRRGNKNSNPNMKSPRICDLEAEVDVRCTFIIILFLILRIFIRFQFFFTKYMHHKKE